MRAVFTVTLLSTSLAVFASEPGQPLDCSDWVSVRPGLTCSVIAQVSFLEELPTHGTDTHELRPDNEGKYLRVAHFIAPITECSQRKNQTRLIQVDGAQEEILGYFENRIICPQTIADGMEIPDPWGNMIFNPVSGEVRFVVRSFCESCTNWPQFDYSLYWIVAIHGLTTTFEVSQTYIPTSNTLGFRVPAIPEGLPAADYFDTYCGDLSTVGDWSQAQPLQCGYPASPPSVGDYLEVADPLPNPDPGHGRYYVTAVHYQGQTRYGRKRIGGVLSGRDPAVLPRCEE